MGTDGSHGSLLRSEMPGVGRKQKSRGVPPGPGVGVGGQAASWAEL